MFEFEINDRGEENAFSLYTQDVVQELILEHFLIIFFRKIVTAEKRR